MSNVEKNPFLGQRPTLNPYRTAAGIILNRLRWDLRLESWISRWRLRRMKGRYAGNKAVILCNGPSLLDTDFDLLKGVFTIGLNKINLLFDRADFRPQCIVAVNEHVLQQNKEFYRETDIQLFLSDIGLQWIPIRKNIVFLHTCVIPKMIRDCSVSIHPGATVTVAALQLAFHLGFEEVALVGCDHNFAETGIANSTVAAGAVDKSHFDPRYFSNGQKWQLPDLVASEYFYSKVRDMFRSHGRMVVNCTEGGKLEIFERLKLEEFISRDHALKQER